MKKKYIMGTGLILFIFVITGIKARASDFSGVWITKSSKSQTIVKRSGNKYSFEKTSFHRGKRNSFKGNMTEKNGRIILKYNSGVSASARIVNPKLIVESSTVKWEKVSDSTSLPAFNLTGKWKSLNSMEIKQNGRKLSGTDSRGNRLSGEIYGYTLYLDVIPANGRKMNYTYLIENNNRIISSSFYSKTAYITRIGTISPAPLQNEDQANQNQSSKAKSVSGKWKTKYYNGKMKIVQTNNRITAQGEYYYFFKKVNWTGTGIINGNSIELKYQYIKNKPKQWAKNGSMSLKLEGNRLKGSWAEAEKKRKGRISFKR